jgi:hypothetical protein
LPLKRFADCWIELAPLRIPWREKQLLLPEIIPFARDQLPRNELRGGVSDELFFFGQLEIHFLVPITRDAEAITV